MIGVCLNLIWRALQAIQAVRSTQRLVMSGDLLLETNILAVVALNTSLFFFIHPRAYILFFNFDLGNNLFLSNMTCDSLIQSIGGVHTSVFGYGSHVLLEPGHLRLSL